MSVWPRWLTFVILAVAFLSTATSGARAEIRSLKLYHLHTHEKAEIVYKRNGRYDPEGLRKINIILRDWRRNEPTKMDPRLLDLVWEAYREAGATDYIQVVCGYRSPSTNALLRSRSRGVAEKSQHMLGKAMDFYIPGVPLKKLRNIGLKMQGGGVGYYPNSGSPFVHMDVGNVRHWPGISRQELVSLFPNGKTLHVPSDGKPLPGYQQALAAYQARKGSGTPNIELASAGGSTKRSGGLFAWFGGGSDEADDEADDSAPAPKAKAAKQVQMASAAPARNSNLPGITIVSPKDAKRANIPQIADDVADDSEQTQQDTPETIIAALPPKEVPLPDFAPRPKVDVGQQTPQNVPFAVADASATTEQAVSTAHAPVPDKVPFGTASAGEAAAADPAQVAVNNIPLPTWRPDRSTTPAELAPKDQNVLMALADTAQQDKSATDAFEVLPTARPQPGKQDEIKAVLEQASAKTDAPAEYQLASLTQPEPRSAFNDPSGVDAASPRQAIAALPAGSDPAKAIGAGVKTTAKEGRASSRDLRPGPKAMVVATPPQAARWALGSGVNIASVSDPTTAPRYAYNIVHTPPSEVYTAGFQTDGDVQDASRFTGNAVKFLSVARFQTK
ncbi:DUF882 domain-containing protein [Mesorhizobium sp. CU2]|uniref:DUF882 domain-containing protein n=1 Tax=unclassified Mesorhizobium TaxID=325217 RepID=UPI0011274051|nr:MULTISPECIES: DUF882 domain-containing protein [unclassified Mesorhizobium]TPN82705.1 DUF882 domain-containing protein [Mesorhizobium sp. CU3]TPO16420.1 DUF882 domain-containing protein [Mesorhizobium sp. CU2]